MQQGNGPRLGFRPEIDQKVTAGDEVDPRERWVFQHVLNGKDNGGPHFRGNPVTAVFLREKPGKTLLRNLVDNRFRIKAVTRQRDGIPVDIGGEDLKFDVLPGRRDLFEKQHHQRIGLLAGAASGNPDTQPTARLDPAHEIRNDALRQIFEDGSVPEETRDMYQEIVREAVEFVLVIFEPVEIAGHVGRGNLRERHAPFDPARQGACLVEREIAVRARSQQRDDLPEHLLATGRRPRLVTPPRGNCAAASSFERFRHPCDRKNGVDEPGRNRAPRHTVISGLFGILCDDEPGALPYLPHAPAAVVSGSGQDDATGKRPILLGKRVKKEIEGKARSMPLGRP